MENNRNEQNIIKCQRCDDANLRVYLHRERFCCNKEFGYDVRDKLND